MATKTKPSANGTRTEVFTLAQAAAFLQVSESALKADVDLGRVPAKCVGGEWRFSRSAILAWLAEPPKDSQSSKDRILETAGIWKDDPTVDAMIDEIYKERKRHLVGVP